MSDKALRYNTGKVRWSLVDFKSLETMVRVLEYGCIKYDVDNWKKGLYVTEIIDSMMRHLTAVLAGEDIDAESGELHAGHILCNALFLSHMLQFKAAFDDRRRAVPNKEYPVLRDNAKEVKQEKLKS